MDDILVKSLTIILSFLKSFPQATLQANKFFQYLLSLILKE